MIRLYGQIAPVRLYGQINKVPTASGGSGGPLQAKTAYPSHSEQIITPDDDYYGLVSVTVKPVPRLPACFTEIFAEDLAVNPIIDISMVDGSNRGVGGSDYAATNNGGSFANGKFVIDGAGFLTVPTDFMAGTEPWTVAFTIDAYTVAYTTYSRVARGNNDVPCIFYTRSIKAFQTKLAQSSAHTNTVEIRDSSFISTQSGGAIYFTFPADEPTTFVFRNDGEYVTFWVNGKERLREAASRYTEGKYASTFSIGDNGLAGADMTHMECSMLKIWDRALTDIDISCLN